MKAESSKEELQPYIDCTGNLQVTTVTVVRNITIPILQVHNIFLLFVSQVWRVNGLEKILLSSSEQTKLYTGECYIFQYTYPVDDREDYLIGSWLGNESIEVKKT